MCLAAVCPCLSVSADVTPHVSTCVSVSADVHVCAVYVCLLVLMSLPHV